MSIRITTNDYDYPIFHPLYYDEIIMYETIVFQMERNKGVLSNVNKDLILQRFDQFLKTLLNKNMPLPSYCFINYHDHINGIIPYLSIVYYDGKIRDSKVVFALEINLVELQ